MSKQNELDTKQRLLEAAIKIFGQKGFIASTVREICQEADVNVAAVNYHFGDKDQLYGTVLHHIFERYDSNRDPQLSAIAASDASAEDRLRAHITVGVLQTYTDNGEQCAACTAECDADACSPYSIFLMEMAHPTGHLASVVEAYIKPDVIQLMGILRDYFGPQADDDLLRHCSDSIWGQILHRAMCWPIGDRIGDESPREIDAYAMAEHITAFTLGGLQYIKQQLDSKTE